MIRVQAPDWLPGDRFERRCRSFPGSVRFARRCRANLLRWLSLLSSCDGPINLIQNHGSRQVFVNHPAVDVGRPALDAVVVEAEPFVVEAEQVQHCGAQGYHHSQGPTMSSVTARTFRRIRTEVCAEVLVARGFHEDRSYGDAQFVRIQGSQLQAIDCQRSTKAPEFAINLAFDFVGRPLVGGSSCGLVDPNMCMTEYAFKTRLGEVQVGWDKWWPLGQTISESRELLRDLLEKSVAFLDSMHEKWPEPERFLGLVEPADIVDVVKESRISWRRTGSCECISSWMVGFPSSLR